MANSDYRIIGKLSFSLGKLRPNIRLNNYASLLFIALTIAFSSVFFLRINLVMAQEAIAQSPSLSKNTIYVNSQDGNDAEVGKKSSPLKTITQALKVAPAGSTIQLASGKYSEDTGEVFPLILQNKITLKGDPQNKGYKTIIQGDGYFISPTGAGQNVVIAVRKDAGSITGITVTNNHSRGHGIWIESASPQIVANTLTRNGNTGISINGKSLPLIEDNYFYNNSGNGLLVYGTSQPEVVKNTFEQTGFGISLVQHSTAQIRGNLFDGNRIGIILEGNSQGTLRDNEIINSSESGLTAIAQSRVDLGTEAQPGNNIFRSNHKLDIQNATDNEIVAVGTKVQGDIQGKINFDQGTFVTNNVANNNVANNNNAPLKDLPPLLARRNVAPTPIPIPTPTPKAIIEPPPANLPAPPPVIASNIGNKELVFTPSASSSSIVPDVEPVPYPPQFNTTALSSNNAQVGSLSDVLGSRASLVKYKVLVEVLDQGEESEVRSLYPESFKTIYLGEPWLQIGAFSNRDKAKRAEQNLVNLGLETYLIE